MLSREDIIDKTKELESKQGSNEDFRGRVVKSSIQMKLPTFEAQYSFVDLNLGTLEKLRMTKVNGLLTRIERDQLVRLIKRYKDCFALSYHDMLTLVRKIVEHSLEIGRRVKHNDWYASNNTIFYVQVIPRCPWHIYLVAGSNHLSSTPLYLLK